MWDFSRINKAREADCAARGLDESQKGDFTELGSESPLFRYALCIGQPNRSSKSSLKIYDMRKLKFRHIYMSTGCTILP